MPTTSNILEKRKELEAQLKVHQQSADFYNNISRESKKAAKAQNIAVKSIQKALNAIDKAILKIGNADKASYAVDAKFSNTADNISGTDTSIFDSSESDEPSSRVAYDYEND